jgi:sarcosine/dimethylglycine N-methyltransferase
MKASGESIPHYQHNRHVPPEPLAPADPVGQHYSTGQLAERIFDALRAAGIDPGRLKPQDTAPIDQFHIGGRAASMQLAKLAGIQPGWQVLDVGGGLGGAARLLATQLRCQVTVLDRTREFVEVGATLSERMDLAGLVHFREGDALDMPFENARFDAVWTQHSTMNIAEKEGLYREINRVLRRGGHLAMHEVVAGPVQPVRFPAPWSRDGSTSFLLPAAALRALIARCGFRELVWQDTTEASASWFKRTAPVVDAALPTLNLRLILGESIQRALQLQRVNLEERRIEVVQAAFDRS